MKKCGFSVINCMGTVTLFVATLSACSPSMVDPDQSAQAISSEQVAPTELVAQENTRLAENFQSPPAEVNPWVYWYWYADHISKPGIKKDLEAMKRANIGTALIGNIYDEGSPGEVKALSPEWWDAMRYAIKTAGELGIDIGIFNSPGWSQSGGPWVSDAQSMRYLHSDEITVSGPQKLDTELPTPAGFYQDVSVLAYKTPKSDGKQLNNKNARISASTTLKNIKNILDGDLQQVTLFPEEVLTETGQIQFDIVANEAVDARSLQIFPHDAFSSNCTLEVKQASGEFTIVDTFTCQRPPKKLEALGPEYDAPITISFPSITASHFRLTFNGFKAHPYAPNVKSTPGIKDIVISEGYKLHRYVEKKLAKVFPMPLPMFDDYLWPNGDEVTSEDDIIKNTIDISSYFNDGTLTWDVPEGEWTIVRFGMRPTGTQNGPVTDEARGPEIDKLNKEVAYHHFDSYIGKFIETIPEQERTALKYMVVDSYEKGSQNWTDDFEQPFKQTYGYDPIPYLPVYTGRVVNSVEQSERFLWDMRRLVADRVSHQYTAGLRERANEHGLKLWLENYGHWGFPGEFLQYGGQGDILSGEFWATGDLGSIELKAASSAAHIYGKNKVMSESFTSGPPNFTYHPWAFKKRGDWSFVEGINHTLLHVYIHQPYDNMIPGVNAWFGSAFNRHNTWFDKMGSWIDYLKRSNYLLQQGKYVADVMYFIGEDVPKMTGETNPALPAGYSYDYINAEVILNRLNVRNGEFVLADGMTFKLLVLPALDNMRPQVLAKIAELVKQGGTIYGPKPTHSPSLENYPEADQQVLTLANAMWQNIEATQAIGKQPIRAKYGKGYVYDNGALQVVLDDMKVANDVANVAPDVLWTHRASATHDIYFITNQADTKVSFTPRFRVHNKQPELWNPYNGKRHYNAQFSASLDGVDVPLSLEGRGSVFIVFSKAVNTNNPIHSIRQDEQPVILDTSLTDKGVNLEIKQNGQYRVTFKDNDQQQFEVTDLPAPQTFNHDWVLNFEAGKDAPETLKVAKLKSLTELASVPHAVKYFSGSVRYTKTIDIDAAFLSSGQQAILDLGEVGVIAQVYVNGHDLGEYWSRPMLVDITEAANVGVNTLEIVVTNPWRNRLLGDKRFPNQFPDSQSNGKNFETQLSTQIELTDDEKLQPSGLIGPVVLTSKKQQLIMSQ